MKFSDMQWFSPAVFKAAMKDGHMLPVVKVPGSGECPYGWVANKVCGVSMTSNRLVDRMQREVFGCSAEIENVPVSGIKLREAKSYNADGSDVSPFDRHVYSSQTVVEDPRGFKTKISRTCYEQLYADVAPGKAFPDNLVYIWPATKGGVQSGPWLLPADHPVAVEARKFSDSLDKKEAFVKVANMQLAKVYEAKTGKLNGRKMAFLGCVPYATFKSQLERTTLARNRNGRLSEKKPYPEASRKALFAEWRKGMAFLVVISEGSASKTFAEAADSKIPAYQLPEILKLAKKVENSLEANPVDTSVAAGDGWETFEGKRIGDWLAANFWKRRTRMSIETKSGDMAQITCSLDGRHQWTVCVSIPSDDWDSSPTVFKAFGSDLGEILESATEKFSLKQPKLGTKRPPYISQIAVWTSWRHFSRALKQTTWMQTGEVIRNAGTLAAACWK